MNYMLTGVIKVLKAQQDRDKKVQALWDTVLDTLDFMKQADPLKEISGLERTVQSMMKQIYECALFLRGYGEEGFIGIYGTFCVNAAVNSIIIARTARNTFTGKTDDTIQGFVDSFAALGQSFHDRRRIDSWKIACATKDGVLHLVDAAHRLGNIGKR